MNRPSDPVFSVRVELVACPIVRMDDGKIVEVTRPNGSTVEGVGEFDSFPKEAAL